MSDDILDSLFLCQSCMTIKEQHRFPRLIGAEGIIHHIRWYIAVISARIISLLKFSHFLVFFIQHTEYYVKCFTSQKPAFGRGQRRAKQEDCSLFGNFIGEYFTCVCVYLVIEFA